MKLSLYYFVTSLFMFITFAYNVPAQEMPEYDGVYIRAGEDVFELPYAASEKVRIAALKAAGPDDTRFSNMFGAYEFNCISKKALDAAPTLTYRHFNPTHVNRIEVIAKGQIFQLSRFNDLVYIEDIASTIQPLPSKGALSDFGNLRKPDAGDIYFEGSEDKTICDNYFGYDINRGLPKKTINSFTAEYHLSTTQNGPLRRTKSVDAFGNRKAIPIIGRVLTTENGDMFVFKTAYDIERQIKRTWDTIWEAFPDGRGNSTWQHVQNKTGYSETDILRALDRMGGRERWTGGG